MRNRAIEKLSAEEARLAQSLVISRDEAVLALNKPTGLASQTRDPEDPSVDRLLWAFSKSNGKRPRLVHRLDRETSGVILAGATHPASVALSKAFEDRQVQKSYLALVTGRLEEDITCDVPLEKTSDSQGRPFSLATQRASPAAKSALTRIKPIEVRDASTLVACTPETGRMHQIRAHLAFLGFPIIGDRIYGEPGSVDLAWRSMLHAKAITVPHPKDGQSWTAEAPIPDDMLDCFTAFGHSLDLLSSTGPV